MRPILTRFTVAALLTLSALQELAAQVNRPFNGRYYLMFDNRSACSLSFRIGDRDFNYPAAQVAALGVPAGDLRERVVIRVSNGQRLTIAAETHTEVSLNSSCEAVGVPFDASRAEARYAAELESLDAGNDRWRRRGTAKVMWGSLIALGGVAAIASGSNAGVGLGFGAVGIGLGFFMEAGSDFRRARHSTQDVLEITRLNTWLDVIRGG